MINPFSVAASKSNSKSYAISKLKTGDLVKIRSDRFAFIYHYGIVCRERDEFYVYHNDPDKVNICGGNIIREEFDCWIRGREIVEVTATDLDMNNIEEMVKRLKAEKYSLFHFNCEHFITKLKDKRPSSPQIANWSIIVAATAVAILLIRKSK